MFSASLSREGGYGGDEEGGREVRFGRIGTGGKCRDGDTDVEYDAEW